MKIVYSIVVCALVALHANGSAIAGDDSEAKRLATQVCGHCHGPNGDSISPTFPRLAGQSAEYTEAQLKAFKEHKRGDRFAQAYMWGMASQLDEDTIKKLSTYYAAEKPKTGRAGDAARVARGKTIYENGIPEVGVLACTSCHGADGEGKAAMPRLAGQHPDYLVKQMVAYKTLQRANAPVMQAIADKMTVDHMRDVAEYVASR